jgi:hypothetical protein
MTIAKIQINNHIGAFIWIGMLDGNEIKNEKPEMAEVCFLRAVVG